MKIPFFLSCALVLLSTIVSAQVKYSPGPALDNDRDNKMNRMLGGDDNSFYCYRIRTRGRGTSFYVEKYDKKTLQAIFSQEISLEDGDDETKIEDVRYADGNVYIFRRSFDKKADQMTLFYQTVSSSGKVSTQLKPIIVVTADHYEFVDFDIYPNPGKTKFLVKCSHKPDKKSLYTTDFILMDVKAGMAKSWTKTVNLCLSNNDAVSNLGIWGYVTISSSFTGLYLDDKDNVFFCHLAVADNSNDKESRHILRLEVLGAAETTPKTIDLEFDDNYSVKDVEFSKTDDKSIVVGGFLKDVIERTGRDLVKVGVFSFKIDLNNNTVVSSVTNFFDEAMLAALESNKRRSRYLDYKLDYILPIGDAVYYVGEQYHEQLVTSTNYNGATGTSHSSHWEYEYMDVIVAKLNSAGKFEWIKNVPLRNEIRAPFSHVFKQYIAVPTNKSIYILCNDHPKNIARYEKETYDPKDLKSVTGIHGSNFVSNAVDVSRGTIKRSVIFENDKYCFAPIQERNPHFLPPSECEIFVAGKNNQIYIYTEDGGRDQFGKLIFE